MLSNLYELLIVNKQKAIIGFVLGFASLQLGKHGLSLDMTLGDALQAVLAGVIGHGAVYFTRNR